MSPKGTFQRVVSLPSNTLATGKLNGQDNYTDSPTSWGQFQMPVGRGPQVSVLTGGEKWLNWRGHPLWQGGSVPSQLWPQASMS
jgi:hypothetical protein